VERPQPLTRRQGDDALDVASSLGDPVRRRLYAFVAGAVGPVGRDEAATAAGIGRSLAAYHLDQLVDDGLLDTSSPRRSGRSGPGAGRPAKLYAAAPVEVTVQLPARDDALVAHLLATAIEDDSSGAARTSLRRATRAAGRALGRTVGGQTGDDMVGWLEERGYAPVETPDGIRLRNCPFHHLVENHLDLVCALNCDLLGSAASAAGLPLSAELDPRPGMCCVVLRPAKGGEPVRP
jgi:predicted ArsR family transcriptional regulator